MALALALSMVAPLPALAKTAKEIGHFGNWRSYVLIEDKQPVCYMALTAPIAKTYVIKSKPVRMKNGKTKVSEIAFGRNDAHLLITHRPAEGSSDVVSYQAGYSFKAPSDAHIRIGKENFSLFTQQETAWTRDARTDHALAAAIRRENFMTVTGQPMRKGVGPLTDKIALQGADAAWHAISKACGLEKTGPKTKGTAKTPKISSAVKTRSKTGR